MKLFVKSKSPFPVRIWLFVGLVMIFFQVILGGITRLTGSGLSITKWDIVTGIIPPLSEDAWQEAYQLYQQTPQYEKVNKDMNLTAFKHIYFWEFIHRLWARSMGFVFIFPLLYFLRKRWIHPRLKRDLWIVFFLAAIVASFGWIMVASGLVNRPWVNAYKLMLHLSLAILLFEYLLVTFVKNSGVPVSGKIPFGKNGKWLLGLLILVAFQVMLGGLMSGMKAGFSYPSFPKMNGEWIPNILMNPAEWTLVNMKNYDSGNLFATGLVQFVHRLTAYIIAIVGIILIKKVFSSDAHPAYKRLVAVLGLLLSLQITLGIFTLLGCRSGKVPLTLGVMHQAFGLLSLSCVVVIWFLNKKADV